MKQCRVVIGSGYGDEGKGISTDYLSNGWADLVVRFNGGSQAAHTVHNKYCSHVFGHFGSATLRGIPTYLSKKFVTSPFILRKERVELIKKGIDPKVYIHKDCFVTTLFDILINQTIEEYRGKERHGSVGAGFNETITRDYDNLLSLRVDDWSNPVEFRKQVDIIGKVYFPLRLVELGIPEEKVKAVIEKYNFDAMVNGVMDSMDYMMRHSIITDDEILKDNDKVVFEGAQGLLLDEFYGEFPYVTRSRTGIKNTLPMIRMFSDVEVDVFYVTRAYTTRHGAGPLLNEEPMPNWVEDTTNIPNQFQGSLRYAPLNFELLSNTIQKDFGYIDNSKMYLIVTCMDQLPIEMHEKFYGELVGKFDLNNIFVNYSKVTLEVPLRIPSEVPSEDR